jgi:hypothetical protein
MFRGYMFRKALATAMLLVVVGAGRAGAVSPSTRRAGHCDGPSTYTLVVTQYDATTLRVRFAIANSTPGETWQIFGSDDGARIFAVNRVVSDTGKAAVIRYPKDLVGTDSIKATGLNSTTGESCIASLGF